MKVILDTNLKCTDRLDEEGVRTVFLIPTPNLGIEEPSSIARNLLATLFPSYPILGYSFFFNFLYWSTAD